MIILYQGGLGQGKTLGMTIWGWYLSKIAGGIPIYANYGLNEFMFRDHRERNHNFHICYVKNSIDLLEMCIKSPALLLWDEQHINMDSRMSSNTKNIYLTQFCMYLRKLKTTLFMTSQHVNQIDKRLRNILDVLIDCKKTKDGYYYTIWDYQYMRQLKKVSISHEKVEPFYNVYNTSKIVRPIEFPAKESDFVLFIDEIEKINNEKWLELNKMDGVVNW